MENRLYRSRTDYMIAGVCGGLARYLGIAPTIVRIFFVLFTLAGGAGPIVYLLLWLIIPREDQAQGTYIPSDRTDFSSRANQMRDEFIEFTQRPKQDVAIYIGVILVALGLMFLLQNLHLPWLRWLDGDILWPVLLILGGGVLFWRAFRGGKS